MAAALVRRMIAGAFGVGAFRVVAFAVVLAIPAGLDAQVSVRPRRIDFGERGHGERPVETLRITNRTNSVLVVAKIHSTCSCIKVSPRKLPKRIDMGRTAEIEVSMSSGRAMGSLQKYVDLSFVTVDGASRKVRVPVRMRVFDGYRLEPRELRFQAIYGKEARASFDILGPRVGDGRRGVKLRVEAITAGPRGAKDYGKLFRTEVKAIPGGQHVEVVLSGKHPEGRVWGELEAELDGKPFRLPVVGDVFRGILLDPKQFNFNRVDAADVSTFVERATLRSTDGKPFRVLSMEARITRPKSPSYRLILSEEVLAEGREHVLTARLASRHPFPLRGTFSGKVVVRTDHPEKEVLSLPFFGFFAAKRVVR